MRLHAPNHRSNGGSLLEHSLQEASRIGSSKEEIDDLWGATRIVLCRLIGVLVGLIGVSFRAAGAQEATNFVLRAPTHVRFGSLADIERGSEVSALPLRADMVSVGVDVR